MPNIKTILIVSSVVIVMLGTAIVNDHSQPVTNSSSQPSTSSQAKHTTTVPTFDKTQYSTIDPISIWIVVNKVRPLNPLSYAPNDLVTPNLPLRVPGNETMKMRTTTATALEQLFATAKLANYDLMVSSGYRSYSYQVGLYNGYVSSMGKAAADQLSARPGYSEHQTGLAVDVEPTSRKCELDQCFANTPEGQWLAANAYQYGFIIRYPADKVAITGYEYEPWHLRYVGIALATEMHVQGVETLEEFFGLSGGVNY